MNIDINKNCKSYRVTDCEIKKLVTESEYLVELILQENEGTIKAVCLLSPRFISWLHTALKNDNKTYLLGAINEGTTGIKIFTLHLDTLKQITYTLVYLRTKRKLIEYLTINQK